MVNIFDITYNNLEADIEKFKNVFIPPNTIQAVISPQYSSRYDDNIYNIYNEDFRIKIHSYIVATHALFEHFFEDIARQILIQSTIFYQRKGKVNLFFKLLIESEKTKIDEKDAKVNINMAIQMLSNKRRNTLNNQKFKDSLDIIINKLKKRFEEYLDKNNTIVNKDKTGIYNMLCMVGIQPINDIILNQQLIDFAKERGDFAHHGTIKGITAAEAQTYIDNVLLIAKDVAAQAKSLVTTLA